MDKVKCTAFLAVASVIEFSVAADYCNNDHWECSGKTAFAVALGVISTLAS
eukprot:Awhi_evm1s10422